MINEFDLTSLRQRVGQRLGEKRFKHTLGVERLAAELGELLLPDSVSELCCAALLHDIAKELPSEEMLALIGEDISDDDIQTPAIYHALAAPFVIIRDFPEYATENVISAVRNHTTGEYGMSLFDEIIFISDFCEDGREYDSCRNTRKKLFEYLAGAKNADERISALHRAALDTADSTVEALVRIGRRVNQKTLMARKYFKSKI